MTGGLSLLSYATAPRLVINVVISLPPNTGNVEIRTLSLPVFIESVEKSSDIIISSDSANISVAKVDSKSLTVSSKSGSITFEDSSEQRCDGLVQVTSSSGAIKICSTIFAPSVQVQCLSSSLFLNLVTAATQLKVKSSSGSLTGEVKYLKDVNSVSMYENSSGQLDVKLRDWSGILTAESGSGSKTIRGVGLEELDNYWKKGGSQCKASFVTKSGSISVRLL